MKKTCFVLVALFVAMAVAMPAFAAVELKYGGQFRARFVSQNNLFDGRDNEAGRFDDHNNYIDQRLRLYFTFKASENLQVVTKFEVGDSVWGNVADAKGARVGADMVGVEVKNAYVDFVVPGCPTVRAMIGIQGIAFMNSWVVDDDFAAAVFKAKFNPVVVTAGYIAAQEVPESIQVFNGTNGSAFHGEGDSIDDLFLNLDYANGPWTAGLILFWQNGHNTAVSADPRSLHTPQTRSLLSRGLLPTDDTTRVSGNSARIAPVGGVVTNFTGVGSVSGSATSPTDISLSNIEDNNLFDLGFNVGYKANVWNAYLTFIKNLGSFDANVGNRLTKTSIDYTGWMADAGFNYFCGPWTFNLGGFWTTGQEDNFTLAGAGDEISFFTYPLATSKYFSEIMGGGILDNDAPAHVNASGVRDYQWRGYGHPSNLWTITLGGAWQVAEKTKLSASYWYFGTTEDVSSGFNRVTGRVETDDSIGHELNVYVTQGIVDGLTLDLVGAYLISDDALTGMNTDDDIYELGARLQWNF